MSNDTKASELTSQAEVTYDDPFQHAVGPDYSSVQTAQLASVGISSDENRFSLRAGYNLDDHVGVAQQSDLSVSLRDSSTTTATGPETKTAMEAEKPAMSAEEVKQARADLLSDIRSQARIQARRDFDYDPSDSPDVAAARRRIERACEKAGIPIDSELQSDIQSAYERAYESRHSHLYDTELNWVQRRYYDVKGFVTGAWNGLGSAISTIATGINNAAKAAKAVVEAGVELAVDAGKAVIAAGGKVVDFVTDPQTYAKAWQMTKDGFNTALNVAGKAWDLATSPDTWRAIGNGIASAYDFVTSGDTWRAVGNGIASAWNATVDFVTDPATYKAAWNGICTGASAAWDGVCTATTAVAEFGYNCVTDPAKAWGQVCAATDATLTFLGNAASATGSFLYDMGEAVGVNSLIRGVYHLHMAGVELVTGTLETGLALGRDVYLVTTGQMDPDTLKDNLKQNLTETIATSAEHFQKGLEAVKGAVLIAGELTGITDVMMMAKHGTQFIIAYANNDKAGMTEHGLMFSVHAAGAAMSIGAIAATISTGGAAAGSIAAAMAGRATLKAAATNILKTAAKSYFKAAATSMGKEVVEQVSTTLTREVLESTAREIAQEGSTKLAQEVAEKGSKALTESTFEVMRETASEMTEKLLKEADVSKHVENLTTKLLDDVHSSSARQLRNRFVAEGMDPTNARQLAKELKSLIKSGKGDAQIKQILEDGITKEISEHIAKNMETAFKESFRSSLDGTMRTSLEQTQKELLEQLETATGSAARQARKQLDTLSKKIDDLKTLEDAARKEAVERLEKKVGKENLEKMSKEEYDDLLQKELDNYIDEVVEDGWKGARKGIDDAVRRAVRKGIHEAFRKFRANQLRTSSDSESKKVETAVEEVQASEASVEHVDLKVEGPELPRGVLTDGATNQIKVENIVSPDGTVVSRTRMLNDDTGQWETISERASKPNEVESEVDIFADGGPKIIPFSLDAEPFEDRVIEIADKIKKPAA